MTETIEIDVIYLDNYVGKKLEYAKEGDSGFDLRAASSESGVWEIPPNKVKVIPTGIKTAIPRGFELQVRTRSGSPLKSNFFVANSPGTLDSGYRGEVKIILFYAGKESFHIKRGERIAQMVINKLPEVVLEQVEVLSNSSRGSGGFGSTGKK